MDRGVYRRGVIKLLKAIYHELKTINKELNKLTQEKDGKSEKEG